MAANSHQKSADEIADEILVRSLNQQIEKLQTECDILHAELDRQEKMYQELCLNYLAQQTQLIEALETIDRLKRSLDD